MDLGAEGFQEVSRMWKRRGLVLQNFVEKKAQGNGIILKLPSIFPPSATQAPQELSRDQG